MPQPFVFKTSLYIIRTPFDAGIAATISLIGAQVLRLNLMPNNYDERITLRDEHLAWTGREKRKLKPGDIGFTAPWLLRLLERKFFFAGHWQIIEAMHGNKAGHELMLLAMTVHPQKETIFRELQENLPRSPRFKRTIDIATFVSDSGGKPALDVIQQQIHVYFRAIGRWESLHGDTALDTHPQKHYDPGELFLSVSSADSSEDTSVWNGDSASTDSRDVSSTIRSDALTVLNGDFASTDSRDVSRTKRQAVHLI